MSAPANKLTLSTIEGVRVGHASDQEGGTGTTVILFDNPAVGAVDISGMATSTRQVDSLFPLHPGNQVHAVCLAGGSAFGLAAASGVQQFLAEQGVGLALNAAVLPVVPAAVIYDLSYRDANARPDAAMGYRACQDASADPVIQGSVGAGTGATCGKLRGVEYATKAGIGSAAVCGPEGIRVGALVVANPFGDIVDAGGRIVAGAKDDGEFIDMRARIAAGEVRRMIGSGENTTLTVVVTDALLDKTACAQVARMAGASLARHIMPYNTPLDGDMVFCFSVGQKPVDILTAGVLAGQAAAGALLNAVRPADNCRETY